jgi:putative PEP-CTERM system histidine kinase
MGVVAYFIRLYGEQWSVLPQIFFFVAAVALLIGVLFWSDIGARLRIFLIKHFYRDKYDYRREWLRLTRSLGRNADFQALAQSSLEALAKIVGSRRGDLWLAKDDGYYEWLASLGRDVPTRSVYRADHPVVSFMAATSWVIDSQEYADSPGRYPAAFGAAADSVLSPNCLVVPLDCQGFLQGFVILEKPAATGSLNFEDHDILKTAGKQVGVALAQSLALERLAESRQFEAVNKMSTFLMHDLKNIITQQQLVVANAVRFRDRPGFFDDAIMTMRSGVERMRRVLEQLEPLPANRPGGSRADLSKVLMEVRSHCADRQPVPEIQAVEASTWVAMDRDKLASALTHLVRNAQDATPRDGRISIGVTTADDAVVCAVADTGSGMDQRFIRDRLFHPFDSTKGAQGMGIGAYQVRTMVRAAGGDVEVSSEPAVGTTFRLRLPRAVAADAPVRPEMAAT